MLTPSTSEVDWSKYSMVVPPKELVRQKNRSKLPCLPLKIITGLITGQRNKTTYADMHPEILRSNVFSISTLAYDYKKQVNWKHYPDDKYHPIVNPPMWFGQASHSHFQEILCAYNPDWAIEEEITYRIPYPQGLKFKELVLLGHVDLINHKERVIIELKTSLWGNGKMPVYYMNQLGAYTYIVQGEDVEDWQAQIIKISRTGVCEWTLTQKQILRGYANVLRAAMNAAQELKL